MLEFMISRYAAEKHPSVWEEFQDKIKAED